MGHLFLILPFFEYFTYSGYQSSVRYTPGKDSFWSCGLPLHEGSCFFSYAVAFQFYEIPRVYCFLSSGANGVLVQMYFLNLENCPSSLPTPSRPTLPHSQEDKDWEGTAAVRWISRRAVDGLWAESCMGSQSYHLALE